MAEHNYVAVTVEEWAAICRLELWRYRASWRGSLSSSMMMMMIMMRHNLQLVATITMIFKEQSSVTASNTGNN
jgi:hypothetical protein